MFQIHVAGQWHQYPCQICRDWCWVILTLECWQSMFSDKHHLSSYHLSHCCWLSRMTWVYPSATWRMKHGEILARTGEIWRHCDDHQCQDDWKFGGGCCCEDWESGTLWPPPLMTMMTSTQARLDRGCHHDASDDLVQLALRRLHWSRDQGAGLWLVAAGSRDHWCLICCV